MAGRFALDEAFLRLNRDNTLLGDRAERVEQNLSDLDYWRKLEDEVPNTVTCSWRTTASS